MNKRKAVRKRAKKRNFLKKVIKNLESQSANRENDSKLRYYNNELKRL